jgi:hypothetical protein
MHVSYASLAAPEDRNLDLVSVTPNVVLVLDGVTEFEDLDSGCMHGTGWYVDRLAAGIAWACASASVSLVDAVAEGIERVRTEHSVHCDLGHPYTPASTVAALRLKGDMAEYLVLCDSPVALQWGERVEVISDPGFSAYCARQRADALANGIDPDAASYRGSMKRIMAELLDHNSPGGFWVAAATPEAAMHATYGTVALHGPTRPTTAALLTDGASSLVDTYAVMNWPQAIGFLRTAGPARFLTQVRTAEYNHAQLNQKQPQHHDATAAICLFGPPWAEN